MVNCCSVNMFVPVPPSSEGRSVVHMTPPSSPTASNQFETLMGINSVYSEEGSDPPIYWFSGGLSSKQQEDDNHDLTGKAVSLFWIINIQNNWLSSALLSLPSLITCANKALATGFTATPVPPVVLPSISNQPQVRVTYSF